MKKIILLLIVINAALDASPQNKVVLQEGIIVQVILNENLDSKTSKVGDQVFFTIAEDVVVDSIIVIEKGTLTYGSVVETEGANIAGIKGRLGFSIDFTSAVNEQIIKLRSFQTASGNSRTEEVVLAAALVHPVFLLFKGKDVCIEKGTVFGAYIDREYEFTF